MSTREVSAHHLTQMEKKKLVGIRTNKKQTSLYSDFMELMEKLTAL